MKRKLVMLILFIPINIFIFGCGAAEYRKSMHIVEPDESKSLRIKYSGLCFRVNIASSLVNEHGEPIQALRESIEEKRQRIINNKINLIEYNITVNNDHRIPCPVKALSDPNFSKDLIPDSAKCDAQLILFFDASGIDEIEQHKVEPYFSWASVASVDGKRISACGDRHDASKEKEKSSQIKTEKQIGWLFSPILWAQRMSRQTDAALSEYFNVRLKPAYDTFVNIQIDNFRK